MFKKKKSINLSYVKQGYIAFLCYTLELRKGSEKEEVINLCKDIAGEDWKALYEVLTNPYKNLERIARDYFMWERRLSLWRACFFETYAKRIFR